MDINNLKKESREEFPKIIDGAPISDNHITMFREWAEYLSKDEYSNSFYSKHPSHANRGGNENSKKTKVTSSQLRKFLNELRRIESSFDKYKNEVVLLDPKLAYSAAKLRKWKKEEITEESKLTDLYELLSPLLKHINQDRNRFKNFIRIYEAIVAYHKDNDKD